ncbi:MAG: AraC family transcriptional regulator [Terracidiphilus sp.]|nr:AraC family transcriptional regulator [Terracidiphilus sp.]
MHATTVGAKPTHARYAATLRAQLARRIAAVVHVEGEQATALPGFSLYRRSAPTACMSTTYLPRLIVFLQGEKHISLGPDTYVCGGSNFLLTSVGLPVVSQVTVASARRPILGVMLHLDMPLIREILSQQEFPQTGSTAPRGMAVGVTTPELLRPCLRLLDLLDAPRDIPFLGPLIQREIVYRLLCSPQGTHLRSIASIGEQSHRTARAVDWLRANYTKPLRVEELASLAHMGVSTLHHQFRALTALSPLQYQKRLRLQAARERMLNDGIDAASAAFEVGYESASQFNREYSRLFGQPPIRDVKARLFSAPALAHD